MKKLLLLCLSVHLFACSGDESEKAETHKKKYEVDDTLPPSGGKMSASEKQAQLALLVNESRRTMDSIDVAYKTIRHDSKTATLSLDERETVNEALLELNNAKDLIVLETQQRVIDGLKEKSSALKVVMNDMNLKSQQLMNIANTLTRISGVIEKTTNLLATALSTGLIRPRIDPPPVTPS